ncbi:MAG: hypothetical protein KF751_04685 [Nitrospira sp.]|nr:hypothetical protein [Nitrospira sp.]
MKTDSDVFGVSMPDRRLLKLLAIIAALNVLHLVDHILRGDFHWPIDEQSIGFLVVATVILGGMGLGVWLYRVGRVGARFWTIVGLLGLGLGWLSHFSPMTDQPLSVIYQGYAAPWAGLLAVGCLISFPSRGRFVSGTPIGGR